MLGTRGCKGFSVFLLFQAKYLPTQAGPVLKSRSVQGKKHMALHVDMYMEKYEGKIERWGREEEKREGGRERMCKDVYDLGYVVLQMRKQCREGIFT